jgi:hypothetical protein
MTRTALAVTRPRLTTALWLTAPLVVFAVIYAFVVAPERTSAGEARSQLAEWRARSAARALEVPVQDTEPSSDIAQAIGALLNSRVVGAVANVSIETARAAGDSPVTVSFDAGRPQIAAFLQNLPALPGAYELRSVDVRPAAPGTARANLVFSTTDEDPPSTPPARPTPPPVLVRRTVRPPDATEPRQPDPVVSSILYSSHRRVALIDGRIVGPGDRIGANVVHSIEPDAVIVLMADGQTRRLQLSRSTPPARRGTAPGTGEHRPSYEPPWH